MKIIHAYTPTDIAWYANPKDPNHDIYNLLSQWAVKVGSSYMVLDKATEHWVEFESKADVERHLKQQRLGIHTFAGQSVPVVAGDITQFLLNGVMGLSGTIYAPGYPLLCLFKGEKRLNTWKNCRVIGRAEDTPHCEEMLKVIRNSLCGEPDELPLQDMIDEINSKRETPFRWVMHWLACRYQKPGYTPMTNLWFIGESRGVGKGTLVSLMANVIGPANVGKVNQQEIERGWTDSMANMELGEWDEFKSQRGLHDLSDFLKRMTGNPTFSVAIRHQGAVEMPNVMMSIFSTNQTNPLMTDKNDRSNTFIGTTSNYGLWRDRIKPMYVEDEVGVFADERIVTGFAHLLGSIRLDLGFVRKVLVTEKALSLRSRSQDTVLRWVSAGELAEVARNRGYVDWEGLYGLYLHWVRDYAIHSKPYDLTEFKERMRAHEIVGPKDEPRKVKDGMVSKTKRVPVFDKINPSQHGGEDESEDEVGADANVVGLANRSKWAEL